MSEQAMSLARPPQSWALPNFRKTQRAIQQAQIKACLEAMVENRRFTYTDIFLTGTSGGATMHHANALFVKVMR